MSSNFGTLTQAEKIKIRKDLKENKDSVKDVLKFKSPDEIFAIFDVDDSGLISFEEFRKMLPFLNIHISDAKAFRYFKICDVDGSGEIDIDEFKVTLYVCDPTSGNQVGFSPGKNITPLDAFELFDEDGSGDLDEDEFVYALEYLGIKISDAYAEKLFNEFDVDHTGTIDYEEFRSIFLKVCDLRLELEDRGVDLPAFASKKSMLTMLTGMLIDEEKRELRAIAEAQRHKEWMSSMREKRKYIQLASYRAYAELRAALDLSGQVYVFGSGTSRQFNQEIVTELKSSHFKFEHFDRLIELWRDRVSPMQLVDRLRQQRVAEEQDLKRENDRRMRRGENPIEITIEGSVDPYLEAMESPFEGLHVSMNTVALWGRRVHHVSISENVMFALSDAGEIYSWGGHGYIWHEIQADSIYQTKWRGETTPRSQMLLGTVGKPFPLEAGAGDDFSKQSSDEKRAEIIKVVTKYFNIWEPPPNPNNRMQYLEKVLLPKLTYEDVKFSLLCRGKKIEDATKFEIVELLYDDIILEKRLLGERAHKAIRELETQVLGLMKRKKLNLAEKIKKRIEDMWKPLLEVQVEMKASKKVDEVTAMHNKIMDIENRYEEWRDRIAQNRDDMNPEFSPRGNSLSIALNGITPRGLSLSTPRGFQYSVQIAAGSSHVCLVHKSGQLYTWGIGVSGRLGLDLTESGDPQADVVSPKLVQALNGKPVLRVSCGFSHTGAIVFGGELYMWGSASNGKLGLGKIVSVEECYCSIPSRVILGSLNQKVKKLSCGAAHTGVVTEGGQLFVFGCGDSGRLGLGSEIYDTVYEPRLITSLSHERVASVSCGNTTTIVCTEIFHDSYDDVGGKIKKSSGGRVYISGSENVLGRQCDSMTLLESMKDIPVKQASAGYRHSALVTAEGELYCWGFNATGCCGIDPSIPFLKDPVVVKCLYSKPDNIALRKVAQQSSIYNNRDACFAVDGIRDGNGLHTCSCTQEDSQAWIEVDLGKIAIIDEILLWNRSDFPSPTSALPTDFYSSRLFPCWVMIGREPFDRSTTTVGLQKNLLTAVAKIKFSDNKRLSRWKCPSHTIGRYIRVQLQGFNYLHIAQLEVFGWLGLTSGVGRVSYVSAGRDVTAVVIRPSNDPYDIEVAYQRATYSDSMSADILRQFETYLSEYDKFGRGETLQGNCLICKGLIKKCEICTLYNLYSDEVSNMLPGVGGRRRRLDSVSNLLLNNDKTPLNVKVLKKKARPKKGLISSVFNFRNWFKRRTKITRETALVADPTQIYSTIQPKDSEEPSQEKEDLSIADSGLSSLKITIEGKEFTPGDTLDNGMIVKSSFPKSIGIPAAKSFQIPREGSPGKKSKIKSSKKYNSRAI